MPRVDSKSAQTIPLQSPGLSNTATLNKKKHICPTCDRGFTTSGHLARHTRVHTGERNHKCPFPGCETRCSRQDNLQQHYRIHLAPGSRRGSSRSTMARVIASPTARRSSSVNEAPLDPPPLSAPPSLEAGRIFTPHSPPPDSPPPLAQATLPATVSHMPDRLPSRSSSSPESTYSSLNHSLASASPTMSLSSHSQQFYRSGTSTYQEQAHSVHYDYETSHPISQSSSHSSVSYGSGSHEDYTQEALPQINTASLSHQNSPSPISSVSINSRHSISHISPPQSSYPQHDTSPPSPASSHSHHSAPPTPAYNVYQEESHSYHHHNMISEHPSLSHGHVTSPSQLVHAGYSPVHPHNGHQRFDSPPPILAPIHGERMMRRDERLGGSQHAGPYIHHPQPLTNDYHYQHSMGLGHGDWKSEAGLRNKGIGALVQ